MPAKKQIPPHEEFLGKKMYFKETPGFGAFVQVTGHKCYRCMHTWIPRTLDEKPNVCPSCKSPYWDKPYKKSSYLKRREKS